MADDTSRPDQPPHAVASQGPPHSLPDGFALAYAPQAALFRVKVMAGAATTLLALGLATASLPALLGAMFAGGVAYYFYPLLERRPRLGAGEYGIFVEGLGILGWRGVRDIRQLTFAVRSIENQHLLIELAEPLEVALVADWRRVPVWRALMLLPWKLDANRNILIPLEPFGGSPAAIHERLRKLWLFFRGPIWRRIEAEQKLPE